MFLVGPLDVAGVHWVFLSASGYQETCVTTLVHPFTIISSKMEVLLKAPHGSLNNFVGQIMVGERVEPFTSLSK